MMRLKVENLRSGLHPSETVTTIRTSSGQEQLIVSTRSIENGFISVGWPLGTNEEGLTLVELPRETQSGSWRVWVPSTDLENEERLSA